LTERAAARAWRRLLVVAVAAAALVAAARALGFADALRLENLERLRAWVDGFGAWAPAVFVAGYVAAVVAFLPGVVPTVLAGLLFGPVWGIAWASAGSTLGACAAFLVARYAARDLVAARVVRSPVLSRLDAAVQRHGVRIVMVTRLVPLFPFNLQNYAYGITGVRFVPYAVTSWLCMLPATAVVASSAGALAAGDIAARRALAWLAAAGVVLALLALLPRRLLRKSDALAELTRAR